ncbi:T9SS type A sorting domain-containing protein [Winogradskyella maritima]|uniref:T9SS type A sorting domain-containing protein n=1 Tax=Winogradskyella maritima TaxID=1517766 RepID=A0ABV8AI47_9FLAO|nr:T9SS type A sorting domain-containing protein [Winogradskyella maritima]
MKNNYLFILCFICCSLFVNSQTFEWGHGIGGTGNDYAKDVAVDANDNVYIIGEFSGTVDFDPSSNTVNRTSNGGLDIFLLKLDSSGNFVWIRTYGSVDDEIGRTVTIDDSGKVIAGGGFRNTVNFSNTGTPINKTSNGGLDAFILGLTAGGANDFILTFGGSGNDNVFDNVVDFNNDLIVTGNFSGTADLNPTTGTQNETAGALTDPFVIKLNLGTLRPSFVWAKTFIGNNTSFSNFGRAVAVDGNNNIISVGRFKGTNDFDPGSGVANAGSSGLYSAYISKLDSNGNFLYRKTLVGGQPTPQGEGLDIMDVVIDSNNNIIMTGRFDGTVDFDPNSGTFNMASFTISGDNKQSLFLWKLTDAGNFVYAKNFTSTSNTLNTYSVDVDSNDDIYFSGRFSDTFTQNPDASFFLTANGTFNGFITKMSNAGAWQYTLKVGENGTDYIQSTTLRNDKIVQVGRYSGSIDLAPGSTVFTENSVGSSDLFVQKLQENSLSTEGFLNNQNIKIFPNPTQQYILIQGLESLNYEVLTLQGKRLLKGNYTSGIDKIDVSSLSSGMYIISISNQDGSQSMKHKILKN